MPEKIKTIFIQSVLTDYRVSFFERLFQYPRIDVKVFFSVGKKPTSSVEKKLPLWANALETPRKLPLGFTWGSEWIRVRPARGDILVVGGSPRNLGMLLLVIKARICGVYVVWWGHYWSSTSKSWRFRIRLLMMRLADALLFYVDEEVVEYQRYTGSRDARPIAALNNGIECDQIREIRAQYCDLGARPRDLLFIGRITPKSELKLVIDSLAYPQCRHVTLNVIGVGREVQELHQHAICIGVNSRIQWHGALTDEVDIGKIMNECKVFVYPGSVGLSLIHALAYGLPCIVHDDRWKHMPEIAALSPGQNGLTFKRGDAASLAETIEKLLNDPRELRRMSANSREATKKRFTTEGMAERFNSLLEEILIDRY